MGGWPQTEQLLYSLRGLPLHPPQRRRALQGRGLHGGHLVPRCHLQSTLPPGWSAAGLCDPAPKAGGEPQLRAAVGIHRSRGNLRNRCRGGRRGNPLHRRWRQLKHVRKRVFLGRGHPDHRQQHPHLPGQLPRKAGYKDRSEQRRERLLFKCPPPRFSTPHPPGLSGPAPPPP
mgnify:CR=1 FL=1